MWIYRYYDYPRHRNPGNSPGLRKYLGYFLTLGEYTVYSGNTPGIPFLSSCTVFWKQSKVMSKPWSKINGLLGVPYSGCLDFSSTFFSKNSKNRYWSPESRDKLEKTFANPWKYTRNTPFVFGKYPVYYRGRPQLPMDVPSALQIFQEDWIPHSSSCEYSFAGFGSVFRYLRGNRKLRIPSEWRVTIPQRLGS